MLNNQKKETESLESNKTTDKKDEKKTEKKIEIDKDKIDEIKNKYDAENPTQTKKGRGRGRRKKAEVEAEKLQKEQAESFGESSAFAGRIALQIILDRLPEKKPLTEMEGKSFDLAFKGLAVKYYSSIDRFGEEIAFGTTLLMILIPRLTKKKKLNEKSDTTNFRKDGNRKDNISEKNN